MSTPQQIWDVLNQNIEALTPGGEYVFNIVHNIQADEPVENILAMYEALQEFGVY